MTEVPGKSLIGVNSPFSGLALASDEGESATSALASASRGCVKEGEGDE